MDVLGALSLATDLGSGVPFEKGLRTCAVSTLLADSLRLDREERRASYYAALLRSLGCTATARDFGALFEDDVAVQRELKTLDFGDEVMLSRQLDRFGSWAGEARRAELAERFVAALPREGASLAYAGCEVSATLGRQLGLSELAIAALDEVYERYDGRGFPTGRSGEQLTIVARVVHVAEQAVMAHAARGVAGALAEIRRRAGGHLDPAVCEAFCADPEPLLAPLEADDVLVVAAALEPPPRMMVGQSGLLEISRAFATFADLKGTHLAGHSAHVAELALSAGRLAGLDEPALERLETAALLHDIGRVGVPSTVWDRPGPLGPADWERVRLHPYWTGRILGRCEALARAQGPASSHHERLDGAGYHRGARAAELGRLDRLLAAADVCAALTEDRPYRRAMPLETAARTLAAESSAGRLDAESVAVVSEAAGMRRLRPELPCDLRPREVDVLRLVARGLTNREIGATLCLSARTVQHHLASVYDKTGQRTRAGAAVFAINSGLLPAPEPS